MSTVVLTRRYASLPPVNERDVLRYAGCRDENDAVLPLVRVCEQEWSACLNGAVCYCELPVRVRGAVCDMELFSVASADLAHYLDGCRRVLLFAATVGIAPDRAVAKYAPLSSAQALVAQAWGAERVEALCDMFCAEMGEQRRLKSARFSPGYGDLPLEAQRPIFRVLDPQRRIGVCLNSSLLMSPSKSVTAFVGIRE